MEFPVKKKLGEKLIYLSLFLSNCPTLSTFMGLSQGFLTWLLPDAIWNDLLLKGAFQVESQVGLLPLDSQMLLPIQEDVAVSHPQSAENSSGLFGWLHLTTQLLREMGRMARKHPAMVWSSGCSKPGIVHVCWESR